MVKTTSPVAANTPTTAYQIYAGTQGTETSAGFITRPQAVSRIALGANTWCLMHRVNNGWELRPAANFCWHVTITASTITAGGTGPVVLPDGRVIAAAINWSADVDLHNGDKCLCFEDITDGLFYLIKSGGGSGGTQWFKGTLSGTVSDPASTPVNVANLVSMTEGVDDPAGTVSANNSLGWVGDNGDVCFVLKNTAAEPAEYELMHVKWEKLTRVKDVEYDTDTDKLVQTKHEFIGKDVTQEFDEDILTANVDTFVDSISCSGLTVNWTTQQIKYLGSIGDAGSGNCTHTVPTVASKVIDNIWVSGNQILAAYHFDFVIATTPSIQITVHDGTECTGSGSENDAARNTDAERAIAEGGDATSIIVDHYYS